MSSKSLKTKYNIITIGGAVRDITFFIKQGEILKDKKKNVILAFELGSKINIEKVYFTLGGGACNTAVTFAQLGLKVATLIRVGNDKEGKKVKDDLRIHGVDTQFIQIDNKSSTGFSFICARQKKGKHVAFLYRGASEQLKINPSQLKNIKTDWVYTSSLTGQGWKKCLANIGRVVKEKRIKWAWNPGNLQLETGRQGLNQYLKIVDVLILNESEAKMLVFSAQNVSKKKTKLVRDLLKIISTWGPKIIVITQGVRGAYVYDSQEKKVHYLPATEEKPVDTTGAGDAFASGFISGLIIYQNIGKALKLGILNSGSVVRKIGAQNGLLSKSDLRKI